VSLTPEQIAAIEARAHAAAAADMQRLTTAGYSLEQIKAMASELAYERAAQIWNALAHESLSDVSEAQEQTSEEQAPPPAAKPWWKLW
jgi:hypothetical protein